MPKRPLSHKLEDLSRNKFNSVLPENWLSRELGKDYGVDGEVELFDDNEDAIGLKFYIQLKATNSKKEKVIFNVDMNIDTLNYYKSLDLPVLLVRYSKHTDQLYIKWVNNVDLYGSRQGAKTFRVSLDENCLWKINNSEYKILNDLENIRYLKSGRMILPFLYSIEVESNSIESISDRALKTELRSKLKKYSTFLKFKNADHEELIQIRVKEKNLSVSLSIFNGMTFHNIHNYPKDDKIDFLSKNIMLGVAICLDRIGQYGLSSRIVFDYRLETVLTENYELFMNLLPGLLKSNFIKETLNLLDEITIVGNEILLAPSIIHVLLSVDKNDGPRNELVEKYLIGQVDKFNSKSLELLKGTALYNLGSYYRSRDRYFSAIENYAKCKRFDPSYLERSYFYKELGGMFFLLGKYLFSSNFYAKAIELGDNNVIPQFADALMYRGEYKRALEYFSSYGLEVELSDVFKLTQHCLNFGCKYIGIYEQNRKPELAYPIAGSVIDKKFEVGIEILKKSLNMDMLCDLAWFNLAISFKDSKQFYKASQCFAFSALLNSGDLESWVSAYTCLLNSQEDYDILYLVWLLNTAYFYTQDEFLVELIKVLENHGEEGNKMIDALEQYFSGLGNPSIGEELIFRLTGKEKIEKIEIKR